MRTKKDIVTRFWEKVEKNLQGCWPWTAGKDRDGYGAFRIGYRAKAARANRIVWTLCFGPIPSGMCVLHTCNNRSCCNPSHLVLGTQKENMAYAAKCGRLFHPRGEASGRAKLTDQDVRNMRSEYAAGKRGTGALLAKKYNLHRMTVYKALWGETWSHVK